MDDNINEQLFFFTEITCPVCGEKFQATKTKVKVKDNMPIAYETYLVPVYPSESANPLSYEIDVCPNCAYAAFHKDFKEKNTEYASIVKSFFYDIKKLMQNADFTLKYRTYAEARIAYIAAAFIYEKATEKDYIKLGKCYIRIAWYSKELRDIGFYRKALTKAQKTYEKAYNELDDFKLGNILLYLIAVIYLELGDFESAVPYFNKINGDQKAKKIPEIKEQLEEQTLYLREKLKEINEEMKDKSDEEKKRAKIKRKKAVQVEEYIEPFGVELSKLKARDDAENNEIASNEVKKKKMMIVDYSKLSGKTIEKAVADYCEVVSICEFGVKAIAEFTKHKPDIVSIETDMPDIDGLTILQQIKDISDVRVIMITGNQNSAVIKEAISKGADAYILKPLDKEKLLSIIKKG